MQFDDVPPQLKYECTAEVRDVLTSIGRTEDVRFSPTNCRLAITGFSENKIAVFDISIDHASKQITLSGVTRISSAYMDFPHGLDFIDDEKIIVANRMGIVCVFELPLGKKGNHNLKPLAVIGPEDTTPGSVAVIRKKSGLCDALICNNYINRVTRHSLNLDAACRAKSSDLLLQKWLEVPDGICVSSDTHWIAVSNHDTHTVLLYENSPSLNSSSDPDGILRSTYRPHGLRFTSDGRFLLVADAGSPYINIYQKGDSDWRGVRYPFLSFRVLDEEEFLLKRHEPLEAGAKGVDVSKAGNIIVTTRESQPLAFFDLDKILENACETNCSNNANHSLAKNWLRKQKELEISYELSLQGLLEKFREQARVEAAVEVQALKNGLSWRITAPLRAARRMANKVVRAIGP